MTLSLVQGPSAVPVSLQQSKEHLRVEHNDEDQIILDLIEAATDYVERMIGQKLITQTWRQYVDCPSRTTRVSLETAPARSIVEIIQYDGDGTPQTVAVADYRLEAYRTPPQIVFERAPQTLAPATVLEIDVQYGFGDTGEDVPGSIKRALLLLVAHWYEFRGALKASDHPASLPDGIAPLLRPFQWTRL